MIKPNERLTRRRLLRELKQRAILVRSFTQSAHRFAAQRDHYLKSAFGRCPGAERSDLDTDGYENL
jgi:hypothetical protein